MYGRLVKKYMQNIKKENQEEHFDQYAYDWWNNTGHYKILHKLNPLRLEYITSLCSVKDKKILDIGCGGGLLAEELCKKGASVTGLDSSEKSIKIAKKHARENNLNINYIHGSILNLEEEQSYDCVVCFEMIEHMDHPDKIVDKIFDISKEGGNIFFSTINRNFKSFMFAKIFAEYVLGIVPKGTHQYAKFITPYELSKMLEKKSIKTKKIDGVFFNPLNESFKLSCDTDINYFLYAEK